MKIRAHTPDYRSRVNRQQRIKVVEERLHKELGFTPNLSLRDLAAISVVLFEQNVGGPDYECLRNRWKSSPEFLRLKEEAGNPEVRKLMAEIFAYDALNFPSDPSISGTAWNTALALNGISERFPQDMEIETVVLAAGDPGRDWIELWPGNGSLTLIDKNPFVAEFLEACVSFCQKKKVSLLEGDIFDLTGFGKLFNVVHAGYLQNYLDVEQSKRFSEFTTGLLPSERGERLLIIQEAFWEFMPFPWKPLIESYRDLGFEVVGRFVEREEGFKMFTMFLK